MINSLLAASTSLGTTLLSFNMFPIINIEIKGADLGTTKIIKNIAILGNKIFNLLLTGPASFIIIALSDFVVKSFIIGG